jgi:hypothetical protein
VKAHRKSANAQWVTQYGCVGPIMNGAQIDDSCH